MARLVEIAGRRYRVRRGVLVEIPDEWAGRTTYGQTIRRRPSKAGTAKRRRDVDDGQWKRTRRLIDLRDRLRNTREEE